MSKKTMLLTQVIMTCIMAATMSGIMGLIFTGPSMEWLMTWPRQFVIAFAVTMVAWPISMALSGIITGGRANESSRSVR